MVFVGTKHCIFDDDTLSNLESQPTKQNLLTPHSGKLDIYQTELDSTDYYLIGCDTAQSLSGAYCAIQVFGYRHFEQIAELQCKFGSYTAFGQVIDFTFQWLRQQIGDRIILCIENNTIGQAPIEHLRFHVDNFNYEPYFYKDDPSKDEVGLKTTGLSKPLMIANLQSALTENVKGIKSKQLINQFGSMERTPGGTIRSTGYCDLFMATCFCAFVRQKKALEIAPLIQYTPKQIETKFSNMFKTVTSLSNPKTNLSSGVSFKDRLVISANEDISNLYGDQESENELSIFMPIFNS